MGNARLLHTAGTVTPLQKKRAIAVGALVLFGAAAIAGITWAALSGITLGFGFLLGLGLLGTLVAGIATYTYYRRFDPDNEQERKEWGRRLANSPVKELAETPELIPYDLLEQELPAGNLDDNEQIERIKDENKEKRLTTYSFVRAYTDNYLKTRNDYRTHERDTWIQHCNKALEPLRDFHHGEQSAIMRVGATGMRAHATNLTSHLSYHWKARHVERKRSEGLRNIDAAFQEVDASLEKQYRDYLSNSVERASVSA